MTTKQKDSTLERLEEREAFARKFAEDTAREIGGLAARVAWDEHEEAAQAVARHKRIMGLA